MALLDERRLIDVRRSVITGRASGLIALAALCLDLLAIICALLLAVAGRNNPLFFANPIDVSWSATYVVPALVVGWISVLGVRGAYGRDVFGAGTEEFRQVITSGLLTAGGLGVVSYLAHYQLPRGFYIILFVVGIPGMAASRLALRRFIQSARRRGSLAKRVLIVGGTQYSDVIAGVLRRQPWLGLRVVGALVPHEQFATEETDTGIPIVGSSADVGEALIEHDIDVLVFAPDAHTSPSALREAVWELEGTAVEMVVAPSMTDISSERIKMRPVGGLPLIHLTPPTWTDASRWGKRTFDVVGSTIALLVLSPVLLVSALWVRAHDGGAVLFRQTRVGRHGEEFSCLKFRSMVPDAEKHLSSLRSDGGAAAKLFKMKDDPRVTRPGRLLRRLSLDELPQLVNVLRGDMSLVGPRPPLPREVSEYEGHTARRLHVRPGITGLWQVSGRSDLSWEEAIRLDLYYVDNWSMLQDLNIMLKTVGAVLSSRGAY